MNYLPTVWPTPGAPTLSVIPQPREVGLFVPPVTSEDVRLLSTAHAHVMLHLDTVLRKLCPGIRREGDMYKFANIIVARSACSVANVVFLFPGQWVDTATFQVGRDIAELYAHLHGVDYPLASRVLAGQLDRDSPDQDGLAKFKQERAPLFVPRFSGWCVPPGERWCWYLNSVGKIIGVVARWRLLDGQIVEMYHTLWRPKDGYVCQWVPIAPQKPFMLFNADGIARKPDAEVIIVPDEFTANDLGLRYPEVVFTAVPGGIGNIVDADCTELADRRVHIVLNRENLCRGKLIEQKLINAGVGALSFSVGIGGSPQPFSALEDVAARNEVQLIAPVSELEGQSESIGLTAVNVGTFLDTALPERGHVLDPIIPVQGLAMIHAARGIGKTHVGLGCSFAVATGGRFLRWKAPEPRRVLYIDGEMPAATMQARLAAVAAGSSVTLTKDFLRIITPDLQPCQMPDISTAEGQAAIEPYLDGVELLVLGCVFKPEQTK